MSRTLSFGIGCFNFGPKHPLPYRLEGQQYLSDLAEALEAMTAVDNLSIQHHDFEDLHWTVETYQPSLRGGPGGFIPDIGASTSRLRVAFELHIPGRVQAELLEEVYVPDASSTSFRVVCAHFYHGPVTFVIPMSPTDDQAAMPGSEAVIIVRRFLEREFPKVTDSLVFELVGPSPFHADFEIVEGNETVRGYSYRYVRTPSKGYDEFSFSYDGTEFDSAEAAANSIFSDIGEELAFYYYVERTELELSREWHEVEAQVEALLLLEERAGWLPRIRRFFTTTPQISDASLGLARYEAFEALRKASLNREYSDVFSAPGRGTFRLDVDRELEQSFVAPLEPVGRMLQLLHSRSARRVDLMVVLVASVLGGGVGALLTGLLS